jgi:hypothetical protein
MAGMISLASLSAFSAGGATASVARPQASSSAGAAGPVLARAQSAAPSATGQAASPSLLAPPDKKLPRGSLLNLQV